MNGRKTKELKQTLIRLLGRAPNQSEWRRYKRHGIAIADKDFKPWVAPERKEEIKQEFMEAVRTHQPLKARRTFWQRFVDWILGREKGRAKHQTKT